MQVQSVQQFLKPHVCLVVGGAIGNAEVSVKDPFFEVRVLIHDSPQHLSGTDISQRIRTPLVLQPIKRSNRE